MIYSGKTFTFKHGVFAGLGIIAVAVGFSLLTMVLWNWLCPELFGLRTISFLEALGLLVLSRLLFGWKGSHGYSSHSRDMKRRWEKMSPEERTHFMSRMHYHHSSDKIKETAKDKQDIDEPTVE